MSVKGQPRYQAVRGAGSRYGAHPAAEPAQRRDLLRRSNRHPGSRTEPERQHSNRGHS
jgi:hypothetical protein